MECLPESFWGRCSSLGLLLGGIWCCHGDGQQNTSCWCFTTRNTLRCVCVCVCVCVWEREVVTEGNEEWDHRPPKQGRGVVCLESLTPHTHTHTHTCKHTMSDRTLRQTLAIKYDSNEILNQSGIQWETHTHTRWFLWFTGTLHRCNGFYTVQTVCAITLHLPYT